MGKKDQRHQTHDHQLPGEAPGQAGNGSFDQGRTVVGHLDSDTLRKARPYLFELGFDILHHLVGVRAVPHHHDAAHCLALAVPVGQTPAHFGAHRHPGQVAQQDGGSVAAHPQHNPADIFQIPDVPQTSYHELPLGNFQQASADVAVTALNGASNLGNGNVVSSKLVGIDSDLVLPHETADTGDL